MYVAKIIDEKITNQQGHSQKRRAAQNEKKMFVL